MAGSRAPTAGALRRVLAHALPHRATAAAAAAGEPQPATAPIATASSASGRAAAAAIARTEPTAAAATLAGTTRTLASVTAPGAADAVTATAHGRRPVADALAAAAPFTAATPATATQAVPSLSSGRAHVLQHVRGPAQRGVPGRRFGCLRGDVHLRPRLR